MKKLILIVLSSILPVIAFATDPASFKKGYQWAQQMLNTSIDNQTGGPSTAGYPSYLIPKLASVYHTMCPSADLASFTDGFAQCLEDNGRVMPMDNPATAPRRPAAPPTGPNVLPPGHRREVNTFNTVGVGANPAPTPVARQATTPSTTPIDARLLGYQDGKIFGEQHSQEAYAPSVKIREFAFRAFAEKFAGKEGYEDAGTRKDYIEGFNDGYYVGTGLSERK